MMFMPGMSDGMLSNFDSQCRRICISGTIGEMSSHIFLEQLSSFEYADTSKPITIYINSYGGDVHAATAMYDAIKACSCSITTIAFGSCMSAATLLLAAGDKGSRFVSENCRLMIHEVSGGAIGCLSELQASVDEAKYLQDQYLRLLSKETGVPENKIRADIKGGDFYMSSSEAVKYGLADNIVPTRKQQQKAKKKSAKK
jgi:ATP-dependent Clp protease protease subunit